MQLKLRRQQRAFLDGFLIRFFCYCCSEPIQYTIPMLQFHLPHILCYVLGKLTHSRGFPLNRGLTMSKHKIVNSNDALWSLRILYLLNPMRISAFSCFFLVSWPLLFRSEMRLLFANISRGWSAKFLKTMSLRSAEQLNLKS